MLDYKNDEEQEQEEREQRRCQIIKSITLEEQIQRATGDQLHCKVCSEDFASDQYLKHLQTEQHKAKYFNEIDMEDGLRIIDKLDVMFEEMNQTQNQIYAPPMNYIDVQTQEIEQESEDSEEDETDDNEMAQLLEQQKLLRKLQEKYTELQKLQQKIIQSEPEPQPMLSNSASCTENEQNHIEAQNLNRDSWNPEEQVEDVRIQESDQDKISVEDD